MDATLALMAALRALAEAQALIDQLRAQNGQLQAVYTDLKAEKEAADAVPPAMGRP